MFATSDADTAETLTPHPAFPHVPHLPIYPTSHFSNPPGNHAAPTPAHRAVAASSSGAALRRYLRLPPLSAPAADSRFPPSTRSLVGASSASVVLTVRTPCSSRRRPHRHEAASKPISSFTRSCAVCSVGTPPCKHRSSRLHLASSASTTSSRKHALKSLIRPIKAIQNQPKRVTPIKEVQNQLCRISRSLPRNCILAFLREPKRIRLVHLYHTWLLRKRTLKKLIGSIKVVQHQLYWTRPTRNCILAIAQEPKRVAPVYLHHMNTRLLRKHMKVLNQRTFMLKIAMQGGPEPSVQLHRVTKQDNMKVFLVSLNPRSKNKFVAEGTLVSRHKIYMVGGNMLGDQYVAVSVFAVSRLGDEILVRPSGILQTVRDAIGHVIAWPLSQVKKNQNQPLLHNLETSHQTLGSSRFRKGLHCGSQEQL